MLVAVCAMAVMISCKNAGQTAPADSNDSLAAAAVIDSIIEENDTTPLPMFLIGGPAMQHIIYAFQNGRQLWKLFALEVYGELDECTLNGKEISKEQGRAYLDKVPEGKEISAWFRDIEDDNRPAVP